MKVLKIADKLFCIKILNYKVIIVLWLIFISLAISLNLAVRFLISKTLQSHCHIFWPMNVFWPRIPSGDHILLVMFALAVFWLSVRYLSKINYRIPQVIIISIIILLSTNLIQGWESGFLNPISGISPGAKRGAQYYHDAVQIKSANGFLVDFNQAQPNLRMHSQTHPPGAVLVIYGLNKILKNTGMVSVAIAVLSSFLTGIFLYGILSTNFAKDNLSGFLVFLFFLIPSVQIYYAASIDALIASCFLGVLYFFIHRRLIVSIAGSVFFFFLSSFLTFSSLFLLPVMLGFELIMKRSIRRPVLILLCVGLIYLSLYFIFGFNYIKAFRFAFSSPYTNIPVVSKSMLYIFSRLQGIWEIILFLGPFLSFMAGAGLFIMKKEKSSLFIITCSGLFTILFVFSLGIFLCGETARICLFIYPYLFFSAAFYLQKIRVSEKEKVLLSYLVFGQALFMQAFGYYFW